MKTPPRLALSAACVLGATACAPLDLAQHDPARISTRVTPLQTVRHGADADTWYRMGRYFLAQGQDTQAIDAFRRALALRPADADAHNALAVMYSMQGRRDDAARHFGAALRAAPGDARVHNNLGMHLLSLGQADEARAALLRAAALEPANATIAANLARVGAVAAVTTAIPTPSSAASQVAALPAPASPIVPSPAPATGQATASIAVAPAPSHLRLERVSDQVWSLGEVRAAPVSPRTAPVAPPAPPAQPAPRKPPVRVLAESAGARIEIANGNGVGGLAHRYSAWLAPRGYASVRLTNLRPFVEPATRIQYVDGADGLAAAVRAQLPVPVPLERVATLDRRIGVRVVLGRDTAGLRGIDGPALADQPAARGTSAGA